MNNVDENKQDIYIILRKAVINKISPNIFIKSNTRGIILSILVLLVPPIIGILMFLIMNKYLIAINNSISLLLSLLLCLNISISLIIILRSQNIKNARLRIGAIILCIIIVNILLVNSLLNFDYKEVLSEDYLVIFFVIVAIIMFSIFTFLITMMIDKFVEILKIYLPIIPATMGIPLIDVVDYAEEYIKKNKYSKSKLLYLQKTIQAMVDSAYIKVLPWITIIALFAINISFPGISNTNNITSTGSEVILIKIIDSIKFIVIVLSITMVLNIAYSSSIDVSILHSIFRVENKIKKE